jgi:hypothetical protein
MNAITTAAEVNRAIFGGKFTNAELDTMTDAIRFARAQLGKGIKYSLSRGDTVKFTNTRTGRVMQGAVTKIAIKFVSVDCGVDRTWRVPANMLTKV